ncbi:MAG: T9SS type A sorting domain-containing protein, partial [Calditrichales bacterium]
EMGFSTSYSQDGGHILQKYPGWALKNISGELVVKNGFDWMSAINPEVYAFMRALAVEVAENYDIDGIEYSDRIPAMPVEGGYDSATVAVYKNEHAGSEPPADHYDSGWMRWRADKLSQFFQDVRDSVKARGADLFVSSSPSLYPWSYENYLQDSKTWVEDGIADNVIPQVYRYNYGDYIYELDKSLANFPDHLDKYFAGVLVRSGAYTISEELLLDCIAANRARGVKGEAFFFYEALRANGNLLGNRLKETWYARNADIPGRGGFNRRPKAAIINENHPDNMINGSWQSSEVAGFDNGILICSDTSPAEIIYSIEVPFDAWFDVYSYVITGPLAAKQAAYTVYGEDDSLRVTLDQTNYYNRGWQPLHTVYLEKGQHTLVRLSNDQIAAGEKLTADAVMIMINRKKSPDVTVTTLPGISGKNRVEPGQFELSQNYPNPFNPVTRINYHVSAAGHIRLTVYDISGKQVATLVDGYRKSGEFTEVFNAGDLASGVYFYQVQSGRTIQTKKMILIK